MTGSTTTTRQSSTPWDLSCTTVMSRRTPTWFVKPVRWTGHDGTGGGSVKQEGLLVVWYIPSFPLIGLEGVLLPLAKRISYCYDIPVSPGFVRRRHCLSKSGKYTVILSPYPLCFSRMALLPLEKRKKCCYEGIPLSALFAWKALLPPKEEIFRIPSVC